MSQSRLSLRARINFNRSGFEYVYQTHCNFQHPAIITFTFSSIFGLVICVSVLVRFALRLRCSFTREKMNLSTQFSHCDECRQSQFTFSFISLLLFLSALRGPIALKIESRKLGIALVTSEMRKRTSDWIAVRHSLHTKRGAPRRENQSTYILASRAPNALTAFPRTLGHPPRAQTGIINSDKQK